MGLSSPDWRQPLRPHGALAPHFSLPEQKTPQAASLTVLSLTWCASPACLQASALPVLCQEHLPTVPVLYPRGACIPTGAPLCLPSGALGAPR